MVRLLAALLILALCAAGERQSDLEHQPFQIGQINYFGYQGIELAPIRSQLPLHLGDTLSQATFTDAPVRDAIIRLTGHAPTDVNVTCCDGAGHLLLYIGLAGTSSRAMPSRPAPNGSAHLDRAATRLYDEDMHALQTAVVRGKAGEDDSRGYMLSNDPALRKINRSMRVYALHRGRALSQVLREAWEPSQRRAAAALLGYAKRTPAQVQALADAVGDEDDEVRNNAVRALWVLSAARDAPPLRIDPQPFVALLFSGKWTDRNKGSLLLEQLTDIANPDLLRSLREQALAPLIEGASWTGDPGHSSPFLVLLGRIGNLPGPQIQRLIQAGDVAAIIARATGAPS